MRKLAMLVIAIAATFVGVDSAGARGGRGGRMGGRRGGFSPRSAGSGLGSRRGKSGGKTEAAMRERTRMENRTALLRDALDDTR